MRLRTLLAAALLAVPMPVAADWLQEGGDAQRTGHVGGAGPAWDDVALSLRLPSDPGGGGTPLVSPVIIGRTAFVLLAQGPDAPAGLEGLYTCLQSAYSFALFAVPVDGGEPRRMADLAAPDCSWPSMASDGSSVFVAVDGQVRGYDAATDALMWRVPILPAESAPVSPPDPGKGASTARHFDCPAMAVEAESIYVVCMVRPGLLGPAQPVLAVFTTDGTRAGGPWLLPSLRTDSEEFATNTLAAVGSPAALAPPTRLTHVAGLAVRQGVVAMAFLNWLVRVGSDDARAQLDFMRVQVVDAAASVGAPSATIVWTEDTGIVHSTTEPINIAGPLLVIGGDVWYKRVDLNRRGLANHGDQGTSGGLRDGHPLDGDHGSGCASIGAEIVCGFTHRTYRLTRDFETVWRTDLQDGLVWAPGSLAETEGSIVGMAETRGFSPVLVCLDKERGGIQWRHTFNIGNGTGTEMLGGRARFAVSDGVAVVVHRDGLVTVLGRTAASPTALVGSYEPYPSTDASVRVDMAGSAPGPNGRQLIYRADWGDGSPPSAWQDSPMFEHRYATAGDTTARFFVANDKNQTSSVPVVFHVGQAPPLSPSTLFHPAYQNATYFVIGLLATALAALIGIVRAGRKRRRFHRELRLLEDDYARLHEADARECDTMLAKRKSGARALFLEKKLEEAHASFLERRVDELRRGLRLGTIEAKLKFLPYGMVVHLQRLLQDARVDEWERQHFLDALAKERDLSAAQRATTRKLIDDWFARDASS